MSVISSPPYQATLSSHFVFILADQPNLLSPPESFTSFGVNPGDWQAIFSGMGHLSGQRYNVLSYNHRFGAQPKRPITSHQDFHQRIHILRTGSEKKKSL